MSVSTELTRALTGSTTLERALDLETPHRYVILSDQHKGARDKADAFRQCEPTYRAALDSYRDRGFTLILLGDVEELWEQGFAEVRHEYEGVILQEASFGADRYLRVFGNHDDEWMEPERVTRELGGLIPTNTVYEGIRFTVRSGTTAVGTLLMVHGHQGTVFSHKFRWLSRLALRIWRPLQRIFGFKVKSPSKDPCLRGEHDRQMYEWAATQAKLILVAGHTHRPVWSSRTHLQKLVAMLGDLVAGPAPDDPSHAARIAELEALIADRREKHPPCQDTPKPVPCYFNTGCCIFEDGDITGLELEDGMLRLVKWPAGGADPAVVLEEDRLAAIFGRLP